MRRHLDASGGEIDYVSLVDAETLQPVTQLSETILAAVAVSYGGVRLIDNREIRQPEVRKPG